MKTYAPWIEDIPCWLRITHPRYPWNSELDQQIKWSEIDEEVIRLREEENLTFHEIASKLRISTYSAHKRYIEILKEHLVSGA